MCGIVGILKPLPASEIKLGIARLLPLLSHRGPDEYGSYAANGIGFGHNRLSIIDLSTGSQPMISNRSVLTYNGELYNYLELRRDLMKSGCRFSTSSDTEVVQKALEEWGADAFSRFNGQFALLFWDRQKQTVLAGRDRYGIRPLYYARVDDGYFFSSELKVFDHIENFDRRWDPSSLLEHGLLWNTLGDATVFKGIHSLEGGHYQEFTQDSTSGPIRYYSLGERSSFHESGTDIREQADELRERLTESVRLRLRSDVPVGCYLSGGIDSSVTSMLARYINRSSFKSFSVTFTDPVFDESEYQNQMVDALGFDHYSVRIDSSTIQERFFDVARFFERPVFRTAPVPMFLLSEEVRKQGISVVLTGEAADEILFGYDTYRELNMLSGWKAGMSDNDIQQFLRGLYPHLSHYQDENQLGFLKIYYEGFLDRFSGPLAGLAMRVGNNQILAKMFNKDWGLEFDYHSLADKIDSLTPDYVKEWDLLRRNQYWELKTLLSGYLLSAQGDRMAMSHGIEGRFPFLDHNLVEWILKLPEEAKIQGSTTKFILKECFRDSLPSSILQRPKRPYMAPDLPSFFPEGKPGELVQQFLNRDNIERTGIFDPKMVERFLYNTERRGVESAGYRANMLITFLLSTQIIEYQIRNSGSPESISGRFIVDVIEDL